MRLQCYADDARDPDFIGETLVDLTEALTKGETDGMSTDVVLVNLVDPVPEWFTLMNKDKYAGEVYVELTFWSNVGCNRNVMVIMLIQHHRSPGTPAREETLPKADHTK